MLVVVVDVVLGVVLEEHLPHLLVLVVHLVGIAVDGETVGDETH